MNFVRRFGLVFIIAADASNRVGQKRDRLAGGGDTTIEPLEADTNNTDVSRKLPRTEVTTPDASATTEHLTVEQFVIPERFKNLHESAFHGQVDFVRSLIALGADVSEASVAGMTPLMSAVQSQNLEVVDAIVRQGVDLNRASRTNGTTALILAIEYGNVDIVNYLINSGANVNQARLDGHYPLMLTRRAELVNALIRGGAVIDQENPNGQTALMIASWFGRVDVVNNLIEAGADVCHTALDGRTALMMAAGIAHVEVVKRLLEAGADVGHATPDGRTALNIIEDLLLRTPDSPNLLAVRDALSQIQYVLK